MEEELGCKLFDRSHRKLQLTPAGEYFYQASKRMLEIEDSFVHQTRYIASYQDHTIKIGTSYGFCFAAACQTLANFHQNFPEVHFQYDSMDNDSLIQQLCTEEIDFAICAPLIPENDQISTISLIEETCPIIYPPGHWLDRHDTITLRELENEDFITALLQLQKDCGVDDLKMSDYGITSDECMTLAVNARETMGGLFLANPCPMSDEECAGIFKKAYR